MAGFAGTDWDAVTLESVSGDVVRARMVAHQKDGSVKVYEGSYTVVRGTILAFSVALTG